MSIIVQRHQAQTAEAKAEGESEIFPGKRIVIKAVGSHFSGTWEEKKTEEKKDANNTKSNSNRKIQPSSGYNENAKPSGRQTKIFDNMDNATRRSLIRENEAAKWI